MNKINFLLIIIALNQYVNAQINIIPNPGFEHGKNSPQCNYGIESGDVIYFISSDIYDWKRATCSGLAPFYTCPFQYSYPDWLSPSCNLSYAPPSNSNFIYLYKRYKLKGSGKIKPEKGKIDAIRTGLKKHLEQKDYLFKIIYRIAPQKRGATPNKATRVRIYLTKYSTNWSANWGNVMLYFDVYPTNTWTQKTFPLYFASTPLAHNIDLSDIKNIIIACEERAVFIDYVEISESCPNIKYIQDRSYFIDAYEKASNILLAGKNVSNSLDTGKVIINQGSFVRFNAVKSIALKTGFYALQGSKFHAKIANCNSVYRNKKDEFIQMYDDRAEILSCGEDSVNLIGIDGDTTSYEEILWNFGNGNGSKDKVVTIYYKKPGKYKVSATVKNKKGKKKS